MKKLVLIALLSITSTVSFAEGKKKIDWSLCEREIKENCLKSTDDQSKHECLEKLSKEKVSDECREKNKKLEGKFKGSHKH